MTSPHRRNKSPKNDVLPTVNDDYKNHKYNHCDKDCRVPSPEFRKKVVSPVLSEGQRQTRLLHAHNLGSMEAKKIIKIFEKKKGECGTQFCDSFDGNGVNEHVAATKRKAIIYDEAMCEKVLFVKNLEKEINKSMYVNTSTDKNYLINRFKSNFNNYLNNSDTKTMLNLQPNEDKCEESTVTHKNIAIQHSSIFNNDNCDNMDAKQTIETQHCASDVNPKEHRSKTSLKCNNKTNISKPCLSQDTERETHYTGPDISKYNSGAYRTLDDNAKLRFILKRLIYNYRNKNVNAWKNYIHELRIKHRPGAYNGICENSDFDNVPTPQTSTMRVPSSAAYDEFSSIVSPRSARKYKDTDLPNCRANISGSTSPNSTHYKSDSLFRERAPRTVSPMEFGERGIHPLCYPTILSDSVHSYEPSVPKVTKFSRNIYTTPKTYDWAQQFTNRPETGQTFLGSDKFESEYSNLWSEQSNLLLRSSDDPRGDTFCRRHNLPAVPEESTNCIKCKNEIISGQNVYPLHKGEPNIVENDKKPCKDSKASLNVIENKLDSLIESIHILVKEIKKSRPKEKEKEDKKCLAPKVRKMDCFGYLRYNGNITKTKSDPLGLSVGDNILRSMGKIFLENSDIDVKGIISPNYNKGCEIKVIVSSRTNTKSTNTVTESYRDGRTKTKELAVSKCKEKRSKYHHVRCDDMPHALQLTVDFLVKDRPTTAQKSKNVNQKARSNIVTDTCVNTEPLSQQQMICNGALSVLGTIAPIVEYFWSLLPISQLCKPIAYDCGICKEPHEDASQLSEHIKTHYEDDKECTTCNEIMEESKRTIRTVIPLPKLFTCQHCGQSFTRAYSKQLHELSCKENKLRNKREQSLIILR